MLVENFDKDCFVRNYQRKHFFRLNLVHFKFGLINILYISLILRQYAALFEITIYFKIIELIYLYFVLCTLLVR